MARWQSCPPSPGRTPTARATSATWPASACPPTSSAATCGWPATTCSWSAAPTSTAPRSWSPPTRRASSPRELADRNNRVIVEDLVGARASPTTSSPGRRRATTTRSCRRCSRRSTATATSSSRRRMGAISPSTGRTLPDRYIEGTCPICGYDGARGDQCDNCGNQLDPTDLIDPRSKINGEAPEFVETQHFFLDLPALADALGEWLDEREASGTWRPNVIRFSQNILEDIRPRAMTRDIDWGIPVPLDGLAGPPDQAALRLVRRGHRLPVRVDRVGPAGHGGDPERWREWWNDPDGAVLLLHGQGQHHLPLARSGRPSCSAYDGKGGQRRRAGRVRRAAPADRGRLSSEFLTMEGKQFSSSRGVVIYVRDMLARYQPDALRYFISAAGPGEPGQRLHLGGVRPADQRRARRRLGQPGQPHRHHDRQELRRDPGRRRADGRGPGAARDRSRRASTTVGDLLERHRSSRRIAEAMRTVGDVNKYVSDQAPWKLKGDDERERLGTILHVTAQAVADCNTLLSPFLPHSANAVDRVLGGAGDVRADAADRRGRRTSTAAPATRSSPATTRRTRRWERRPSSPGRRSASRRRSSPSSTRRSSTRSWPGWAWTPDLERAAADLGLPTWPSPPPRPSTSRRRSTTSTAAPSIGSAYTTVAGDVLTRWHRQRGERVWYLTGTDEHGQKVLRAAEANGVTPQEWTDHLVETDVEAGARRPSTSATTTSSAPPTPPHASGCRSSGSDAARRAATSTRASTRARTASAARSSSCPADLLRRTRRRQGLPRSTARRSRSSARRTTSSRCRSTPTGCSRSTRASPTSSSPSRPATRSSRSSGRGCRTCRSRAPPSTGASRCRGTTTHVLYVWIDALLNYVDGGRLRHRPGDVRRAPGRPTFTWSARTSCDSTR